MVPRGSGLVSGCLSYRLCAEFSWGPSRQFCSWQLVPALPTHWESAGFACAAVVWRRAGATSGSHCLPLGNAWAFGTTLV
jgi:hypothetical protein